MVLGILPVPERPAYLNYSKARASSLAVGAGGGYFGIFFLSSIISLLSPSLWETARYLLKYCLKGPLNPNNQPTNIVKYCRPSLSRLRRTAYLEEKI